MKTFIIIFRYENKLGKVQYTSNNLLDVLIMFYQQYENYELIQITII